MIRKAVIPVAGLGTRLMPATKEQPKEMLPVFSNTNGQICVKPLVQIIFENIYDAGVRDFYFIIGRGKRVIEDHFTQDYEYLRMLENVGKDIASTELQRFYKKLENSRIVWVNQPSPRGFGDAVLKVHNIIGNESFLVHAGDTHIISNEHNYLQELADEYERLDSDAILLLQEVEDPKHYGVVEAEKTQTKILKILHVEEKPEKPRSNLAIMPIYIFDPIIFEVLEKILPGKDEEIQLTDAIQTLIQSDLAVHGIKLMPQDIRLDIGNPKMYWTALKTSYGNLSK